MLGKWDTWYDRASAGEFQDADKTTYTLAGEFLADCKSVEDWGCGYGGFKEFCKTKYVGVDGSQTPFVDKVVDLRDYRTQVEGINMRHVLEHNYEWKQILDNALASFTKKFCLILFTPLGATTQEISFNQDIGVPDLSFNPKDIEARFGKLKFSVETIPTPKYYKVEHIYRLTK